MAVTSDGTPYVEGGDAISAYPVVSQELAAVIDSLRAMLKPGMIFPYAGNTAPEGYLMCDGKAYTRTDFYDLYEVMSDWVGEWGGFPGGNSSQFFVPDFRGRSPVGVTGSMSLAGPVFRHIQLGQRFGDQRIPAHRHNLPMEGTGAWPSIGVGSSAGDLESQAAVSGLVSSWPAGTDSGINGGGYNMSPYTGVNFIVWTGTTTAGKIPVPGVELDPISTRMMIEARLEEPGIGEEEIEMLREQLAALKEDTNG